jgi:hypothetical protein
MTDVHATVRRENEYRLGLGEVIVAHAIHPDYGVPVLTFTKAAEPGEVGEDASEQLAMRSLETMMLVFTSADSVNQHIDRLQIVMREMQKRGFGTKPGPVE